MTSIDEAIAKYKEITNTDAICPAHCNISCDKCVQESKQITEWLEELKELKKSAPNRMLYMMGYKAGYNKAIDDFAEKIKSNYRLGYVGCLDKIVDEITEQLKKGGEDEQSI